MSDGWVDGREKWGREIEEGRDGWIEERERGREIGRDREREGEGVEEREGV